MTVWIGVDPGLRSGAVAAIDHNGQFIGACDIETQGDRIHANSLRSRLLEFIPVGDIARVAIENVHSMPGQGIVSTGRFLRATGAIEAICELVCGSATYVDPRTWKRDMGLSKDKQASLDMARELWPEARQNFYLQKSHNKAEAALLSEWLRRKME